MHAQAPANPDDIDLITIGGAIRRSLPKLFILAVLVGAGTAGVLSTMAPRFTAQAQLEVISTGILNPYDPKRENAPQADVAVRMDKEAVGTHVRALLSTDLALTMAKELGLAQRPEFNIALPAEDLYTRTLQGIGVVKPRDGETDTDRVLSAYYKALRVFQGRDTRGITVEFTSTDPNFSANAANRLSELYRSSLASRTITETEDARTKIGPQIERLIKEVSEADSEVTQFRGRANLFQGGAQSTALSEQQLAELTGELTKAVSVRGEADARASAARDQAARGTAEANPDVQKSTLIPRLSEQRVRLERQVSELSATLLPAHPRMKQLQGDLASLQRQIKVEIQKVVDSLERDARIAADREAGIKRRIEETKRTVVTSAPDDARLRQLENVAKSKRSELERLQKQYEAAVSTVSAGAAPVEIKIVQRAFPLNEKTWPKISMMAPLASLAVMLLGLAWTVPNELLRAARGGPPSQAPASQAASQPVARAEERREAPLLEVSALPSPAPGQVGSQMVSVDAAAAALLQRPAQKSGVRTMISGRDERTPTLVEALALARALSQAGKRVVLVDWTDRSPGMAEHVSAQTKPGLAQLLAGACGFNEAVQTLAGTEVQLVASGFENEASPDLFDPDRANLVLDALDEAFDHILVHGPYEAARNLLGAIQGRIDVGIEVGDRRGSRTTVAKEPEYLGYSMADLEVIRVERAVTAPSTPPRRPAGNRRSVLETEVRA